MKDSVDKLTVDLFSAEKRRGRPVTGTAKSNAERMRLYRKKRKEQGAKVILSRPNQTHSIEDSDRVFDRARMIDENDRLNRLVLELLEKNECLSIQLKGSQDHVRDLLATLKSKEAAYKGQITRLRNKDNKLT